ncbi:MAG: flagellar biosynthesis protein FlhB [Planctomycetes bacterium]|nr:flagellar biosynthesis protein FlhB [Planctomycetota bacterium]
MADDLGERTEQATPRRKQESRQEGQVAKSTDLSGAVLLALGTIAVAASAAWMLDRGRIVMENVLASLASPDAVDPGRVGGFVWAVGAAALNVAAPVILVAWGAALLAQVGQVGWLFAPKAIMPKASKMSPAAGAKKIFGISGLVKAGMDSLKVLVVVLVAVFTINQYTDRIFTLPYLAMTECLATIGTLLLDLALRLLAMLLLLGIIDFAYQRWKHREDQKMTKQQVKDEMKQTEGDPEVKRRRLRMQQQIALQRIQSAVPRADVIVTNPEHLAVAIQYDAELMRAPKVVAKGADFLAQRIRQIAMRHGIPIVERKPLARALYADVGVGQEVPPDFYAAVAEVLAYVYRLNGKMAG